MYDVHNERGFFVSEKPEAVTVILTDKPTLNTDSLFEWKTIRDSGLGLIGTIKNITSGFHILAAE